MLDDDITTEKVPVQLSNGAVVSIEISEFGREDVAFEMPSFDEIGSVLEGITASIQGALARAKPRKATVKFGLEMSLESGKLAAAIVKGAGKANLEITLEWNDL